MKDEVKMEEVKEAQKLLKNLYGENVPDEIKIALRILGNEEDLIKVRSTFDQQLDADSSKNLHNSKRLSDLRFWISDTQCVMYSEEKRKMILDTEESKEGECDLFEMNIEPFAAGYVKILKISTIF